MAIGAGVVAHEKCWEYMGLQFSYMAVLSRRDKWIFIHNNADFGFDSSQRRQLHGRSVSISTNIRILDTFMSQHRCYKAANLNHLAISVELLKDRITTVGDNSVKLVGLGYKCAKVSTVNY